ncbi:MAG TPA: glycosyltransferase family 2 protein [Candidatus Omnitrophota bacterium]|nr:glycosyltransferase family 2 protein [Candidatus Omnitrophota bacterium]HPB68121.1 glycosyltransferase family 2 protein [Candidatus Omnitrophota bacterium]HQO57503.1 glycosyltransferase family 2 protein [Candidatus Omnitrophota bacterium]
MNICVIIPAHNEEATIGALVTAVKALGLDVVVINDGSTDGSQKEASSCGAVVLTNTSKKGKGLSLQEGFAYALRQTYSGIITMDGDGQHDPEDLKQFLTMITSYPDSVVTGNRMQNHQGMPFVRFLTNWSMSAIISFLCRQRVPDTQCGYRYIGRPVLERMQLTSRDFEIETEVLMQASRLGFRIYSVPIRTIYSNEKSKINPFKDTVRFFSYLIREARRSRR